MKNRMLAEWENPQCILLAFPSLDTDWAPIIAEAQSQFLLLINSLLAAGENVLLLAHKADYELLKQIYSEHPDIQIIKEIPFNDTWTRDYGPITLATGDGFKELDFGFNGWGLKFAADKDNLVNLRLAEAGLRPFNTYSNHRDFTLEGGSIETDGAGTILTTSTCLCSPNRNGGKDKPELEKILHEPLGADHVLWLDHGFLEGDDTDNHIDTLARIAPNDTILYVSAPSDPEDPHFEALKQMENQLRELKTKDGKPYKLVALPFPAPIYDEDGQRLPATYANYLVTQRNLFVPTYGQPAADLRALETIGKVFPNHSIHGIDCRVLIKQHGSLHCSTMQLYC